MGANLFIALLSSLIVSLISLIGIILLFKKDKIEGTIFIFVSFAIGVMIGNAFFHIIPESLLNLSPLSVSVFVVAGFLLFFIIEKIIHWRHCHDEKCNKHSHKPFTYLNLIGDGVHNFFDGILIGVSYIAGLPVGLTTTIAIISHEIPQELGDFAILIHGGFSKAKALLFNLLSAILAIIGVIVAYFGLSGWDIYTLPLVAGGLLYISMSDLIPEMHKEINLKKSILSFILIILGLVIMYLFKIWLA